MKNKQIPNRQNTSNYKGRSPSNGYTIFGNKSYSYIDSQIYFHRKREIIEQSGI
jgi:hypothetical protein